MARLTTYDTPAGTECQHADIFADWLHERLVADVPTAGNAGEETPTVVLTELGATVGTEREVQYIFTLVRIVETTECTHTM